MRATALRRANRTQANLGEDALASDESRGGSEGQTDGEAAGDHVNRRERSRW